MTDFSSGREFEAVALGIFRVKARGSLKYMKFAEAFRRARESQPKGDTKTVRRLRVEIARKLGAALIEVEFYTSVGSSLDVFHGIDGWFEFRGKVITIDVTLDPEKVCHKADVILHKGDLDQPEIAAVAISRQFLKVAGS